ncbi:hypothetical protein C8R45DRAFT_530636 [Mycena sanguinolenta]|nr:hypothetical protein C8R45DRAFT_530636 [Mycena sanguinolenta]
MPKKLNESTAEYHARLLLITDEDAIVALDQRDYDARLVAEKQRREREQEDKAAAMERKREALKAKQEAERKQAEENERKAAAEADRKRREKEQRQKTDGNKRDRGHDNDDAVSPSKEKRARREHIVSDSEGEAGMSVFFSKQCSNCKRIGAQCTRRLPSGRSQTCVQCQTAKTKCSHADGPGRTREVLPHAAAPSAAVESHLGTKVSTIAASASELAGCARERITADAEWRETVQERLDRLVAAQEKTADALCAMLPLLGAWLESSGPVEGEGEGKEESE